MAKNTRRAASQAAHALSAVTDAQADAMRACDPDTLAALVATVRQIVRAGTYSDAGAVESHAVVIAPSLLAGADAEGFERTLKASRAAVRIAAKRVAEAMALDTSLDAWADGTPDALEDALGDEKTWALVGRMPRIGEGAHESWADRVEQAIWTATRRGTSDALDVEDAWFAVWTFRAYLDHVDGAHNCRVCLGRPTTKRPTLTSITNHANGVASSSAAGKYNSRRAAAIWSRVADFLPVALDADIEPTRGKVGSVHLDWRSLEGDTRDAATAARVTHTRGGKDYGTRAATPEELALVAAPATREARGGWAGESTRLDHTDTAPAPERDRTASGQVRTFAVAPSPRKKSGSGSTGPTIPGRF